MTSLWSSTGVDFNSGNGGCIAEAGGVEGCGTGIIAQLVLAGTLNQPGVWSVEQVLSTDLFEQAMQQRHLKIRVK